MDDISKMSLHVEKLSNQIELANNPLNSELEFPPIHHNKFSKVCSFSF
jgi:hypothetical protein